MVTRKKDKAATLTNLEFKIIDILWNLGGGTVRDVVDAQVGKKPLAYTTVATVLKIIEEKGFVRVQKKERVLFYSASLKREVHQTRSLGDMVNRVFAGNALSLMTCLLDTQNITRDDLLQLRTLIDEGEEK